MPIYEYECASCHHTFDRMQKMTAEPVKQCPECHKDTVVRLVSAAGFQLKGSGWYATDFKDKGKPKAASESTTAPAVTQDSAPKTESTKSTSKGESD